MIFFSFFAGGTVKDAGDAQLAQLVELVVDVGQLGADDQRHERDAVGGDDGVDAALRSPAGGDDGSGGAGTVCQDVQTAAHQAGLHAGRRRPGHGQTLRQ